MNLLPKASGTRPRVACDISPQGVVAARSAETGSPLAAVARVQLAEGAITASLKPGNIADRVAVTTAVRRALESVGERPNSRGSDITLIVPDAAVRVLLLEFDALPTKLTEALPLVRFRLKKMLPFDADDAMVTYQVMSTSKTIVRVLAVAIPRDVLSEYETVTREAGFEPGSVIPSTLAALAAVEDESPELLINANDFGVTAAIVRSGILMLHRSVDLQMQPTGTPANLPPALFEAPPQVMPLDFHETAGEWAAQEPLPEHGRNPYADRAADEVAVQDGDGITELPVPDIYASDADATRRNGEFLAGGNLEQAVALQPVLLGEEIAQAVSVAVAYFEDTLASAPSRILSAGPLGADALNQILAEYGLAQADGLYVRELVDSTALLADAVTASVPRGWLSGVIGALRG